MTMEQIEEKYIGRRVNQNRLDLNFRMMGKFGRASMYDFSFHTSDYKISTDVCIERGRITGIVPDKEQREDDWGRNPDPGPEEIQPEEYDTIARYLDCVLAAESDWTD